MLNSRGSAKKRWAPFICASLLCATAGAEPFRFSTEEANQRANDKAAEARRAHEIQQLVSIPCQRRLKNRRILQLISERTATQLLTRQDRYAPLFRVIDARLQALGLKTYTQEQIRQKIAQAEVDAYFKNDPDEALAASKKLAADYVLRGSISTRTGVNSVVQVNEVAVNIEFTLSGADGRVLSTVQAHSDSYSGVDTLGTALTLVREQADPLVAQLYNDYCRNADGP
jgi:hypothetical protein